MLRRLTLACAALLPAAAPPPPPAALAPYIRDGRFDPGDYGWARGGFADAAPAQQGTWTELRAWLDRCAVSERERSRRELAALGVTAVGLDASSPGGTVCGDVAFALPTPRLLAGTYPDFARALSETQPVVDGLRWSVELARQATAQDEMRSRAVADQMLRRALGLGAGESAKPPALSPSARDIARSLIGLMTARADADDAAWLDARLRTQGWPKISEVGRQGANDAWLLAQHADAFPAFQLRALRAMEPLVAAKEADGAAYALLHDRVALKVSGRQRYGTQVACVGGARVPQPLEEAAGLDRRRADVGLPPIADYLVQMDKLVGPCPRG